MHDPIRLTDAEMLGGSFIHTYIRTVGRKEPIFH